MTDAISKEENPVIEYVHKSEDPTILKLVKKVLFQTKATKWKQEFLKEIVIKHEDGNLKDFTGNSTKPRKSAVQKAMNGYKHLTWNPT